MTGNPTSLEVSWISKGRTGTGTITVSVKGGEPLAVDTLNIAKAENRESFANKFCQAHSGIEKAEIEKKLLEIAAAEVENSAVREKNEPTDHPPTSAELLEKTPKGIRDEASSMLSSPGLMRRVLRDIRALGVAGEHELTGTIYLVGISRLLSRPLAAIVQGPSSSGKSYMIEKSTMLIPPEGIIHATAMTPQALFHAKAGTLTHRLIVAGERSRIENDETAEATRALREMLSAGKLSKLMPMKVEGRIETVLIEQEGPIAFLESTTQTHIFEEDANRALLLQTDERKEQTERILHVLASGRTGGAARIELGRIVEIHHTAQRMLEPIRVAIPFAGRLATLFPTERVEARRAFDHLLNMVEATTLLYQRQRELDPDGNLLATPGDYALAKRLLDKPLGRLLGSSISDASLRAFERLRGWATGNFTNNDLVRKESVTERTARNRLRELHEAGYLELVEAGRGPKPHVWKIASNPPEGETAAGLPSVGELFPGTGDLLADNAQSLASEVFQAEESSFSGNSG